MLQLNHIRKLINNRESRFIDKLKLILESNRQQIDNFFYHMELDSSLSDLDKVPSISKGEKHRSPIIIPVSVPKTFEDIFIVPDWAKYITPLEMIEPPLIKKVDNHWEFIGKRRSHKGVIGSWIFDLQAKKGVINQRLNRQQLALVLNNEIKHFNMGMDGKTIINHSELYDSEFKNMLSKLIK